MPEEAKASDCDGAKDGELITRLEETAEEIKDEVAEIRAIFSGPIPPPDLVRAYEDALPGLADRIVGLAESEGEHRRRQEEVALDSNIEVNRKLVDAHIREVRTGQLYALVIAIVAIGCGSFVAVSGGQFAGAVIGAGGLVGIVTAFIQGRRKDDSTQEEKGADMHNSSDTE